MKRFRVILVIMSAVVFLCIGTNSFTIADITAPVLHYISVDKSLVTVDEVFTVTVNVTDDVSGVSNVSICYVSPSGGTTKKNNLDNVGGDLYEGALSVEQYDEMGTWKVHYVAVSDGVGNSKMYHYDGDLDLSNGDIIVYGTTPDIDAPILNGISIDKSSVTVDEAFTVTVNVTDNLSGVLYVRICYISPSGDDAKHAELEKIEGDLYKAEIAFDQNDELGNWNVHYVAASDVAGNIKMFHFDGTFDLTPGNVQLKAGDCEAPIINCSIESGVILPKGTVLEFNATDDVSGIKSVEAYLTNGTDKFSIGSPYILTDGVYTLEITAVDNSDNTAFKTIDL